jgi:hypothetical protein
MYTDGGYSDSGPGRSTSSSSISRNGNINHYLPETTYPTNNYETFPGPSSSVSAALADRGGSYASQPGSEYYTGFSGPSANIAGPSNVNRHPSDIFDSISNYREMGGRDLYDDDGEYWDKESEEVHESNFIDFSLLSHIAVQLRDKVPRGTHVKGSIPYPRAFTGKDIVVGFIDFNSLLASSDPTPIVNNPVANPTRAGH